jgi:hypothetical protein
VVLLPLDNSISSRSCLACSNIRHHMKLPLLVSFLTKRGGDRNEVKSYSHPLPFGQQTCFWAGLKQCSNPSLESHVWYVLPQAEEQLVPVPQRSLIGL